MDRQLEFLREEYRLALRDFGKFVDYCRKRQYNFPKDWFDSELATLKAHIATARVALSEYERSACNV